MNQLGGYYIELEGVAKNEEELCNYLLKGRFFLYETAVVPCRGVMRNSLHI
jgi:hypothetical protein